ncbi:MAG: hypothetical protein KGL91_01960 [Xanthomonadaceae bacterium]|nr:hypothetical protein [Xanthomonadaceae bacterium]
MITARAALIAPGTAGSFHCVQRCVRRAFLCGEDRYTGQSFEHRKAWVEQRLLRLAECFAVAIHAYAVMSNHLHVVVQFDPAWLAGLSDTEVADRWVRLYPPRDDSDAARVSKCRQLLQQPERLAVLRARLSDLSWFMKCLAEPIARSANAEDGCKGRFWEGRFKAQRLCDERALLAAMAYVDLNPVRAGMARALATSDYTSIQRRLIHVTPDTLDRPLRPIAGEAARVHMGLSLRAYVGLVDWTGQQMRPGKRGALAKTPRALARYEADPGRWAVRVKAIGSGYWRIVGSTHDLIDAAQRLNQRWVKGIGLAQALEQEQKAI